MPEQIALLGKLKVQLDSIKSGKHNLGTMEIMANSIMGAVKNEQISWEKLGTSETELKKILKEKSRKESGVEPIIKKFIALWNEYSSGKKDCLEDLLAEFTLIKKALGERKIQPNDLMPEFPPHEYFKLDGLLSEQNQKL